jgi:hypothetical protein
MAKKPVSPIIREIDLKLREIESGRLGKPEKYHLMESVCGTLRGYLRSDFGLDAANNLKAILEQGRNAS